MMEPLSYGVNPNDEMIYPFLYRGLIRYTPETNIAREDLAQCDISKIEKISCTLKKDMRWSDNTIIKNEDILATFRGFSEFGTNPDMKEVLRDTRIEVKNGSIIFNNPDKDINVIKLLTYPIYRSDMVEQMKTNRFTTWSHITSGQYTFLEESDDTTYMNQRITLIRNDKTSITPAWFDKISFKFFENASSIKNAEDTLWIIIPPTRTEQLWLSDRFRAYNYTTYEYFSVFFQTDRLQKTLRNALHWQIGTSFSGSIEDGHKSISNIFPGYEAILPTNSAGNFSDIMKKSGYMKRDDWISQIENISTTVTGSIIYDRPRYFTNKANSNVLFLDAKDGELLLNGKFDPNVSAVIINGYQLKEFKAGNKQFAYRVSIADGTMKEGKNTFLLEGKVGDTTKVLSEILTVYYTQDAQKMAEYKKSVDNEYIARNNTPALIAEREREKQKKIEAAKSLDPLYYYDKDGKVFKIVIAYITGPQSTEKYAQEIEKTLKKLSLQAELVAIDPKWLQEMIKTGKKDYDIIIAGLSTGDTLTGIGQLFDPANAGKWINLANIEIQKLPELFIALQSATTPENMDPIMKEIIWIMKEESFFFPIATPLHSLYIDRNLKWIRDISSMPWMKSIYDVVEFASIKDTYVFDMQWKSIGNFFSWVGKLLF